MALSSTANVRLTVSALSLDGDRVALDAGDRQAAGQRLNHDFADYRRLVRLSSGHRVLIDVPALRRAVVTGPVRAGVVREQNGVSCEISVLKVTAEGVVTVCEDGAEDQVHVAVNREFLLQALAAGARDQRRCGQGRQIDTSGSDADPGPGGPDRTPWIAQFMGKNGYQSAHSCCPRRG